MTRAETPSFLRALRVPWNLASVLFVAISAALLAFFQDRGVFGIVGTYFLLSWLFKYAYVVLEHVANGRLDAPVVSVEMLGPFEQRPLIQIAWCFVLYAVTRTLGGVAGTALAALLLMALPATVAVLGLGLGVLQSVNPLTLWRTIRGLGLHYFGILGLMAAAAALIFTMGKGHAWNIWTIAVAQITVLTVFSTIGGALFERRLEIGHEPAVSPERQMEKEDREYSRRLGAMLDEVYAQTRLKRRELALEPLRQWLAQADDRRIGSDAHTIMARVAAWNDADALSFVSEVLITQLKERGQSGLATDIHQHVSRLRVKGH